MDLRAIINTDAGESSGSKARAPITPVQAHPPHTSREYNLVLQASPSKHASQDYGPQPSGPQYPPQSQYQQTTFQGRPPPPPPIQAPPQNDLRSPIRPYSAQSPYQQTSSSTSSQYPFPQHHTPQSPAHPYPAHLQQRDSYPSLANSQINPPTHLQHQSSFNQNSPPPQTPPIGIPGAPHPYLQQQHQRSTSSTTPTSAHSQQQQYFSNQFQQDSPSSANFLPTSQIPHHQRQQSQHSQPGTPLGPPLAQRQSSGGFAQPSSPYQQRGFPSGSFHQFQQTSPVPLLHAALPRLPSTPSGYESQETSRNEQQRRSQSERERSISVSPKTRVPSQPLRAEGISHSENSYHMPARVKSEEREIKVERGPSTQEVFSEPKTNGDHRAPSNSPQQPPRKRIRYTEPPIWAQSIRTKGLVRGNRGVGKMNGKQPISVAPSHIDSPNNTNEPNGHAQASAIRPGAPKPSNASLLLGPWEASITGAKPFEQMTKWVADFIYLNVVGRDDIGELASTGIEVEIEAKLGQIIDKDTNDRLRLPVESECILSENQRHAFRSSMTEVQHQKLNDFLNTKVKETHPGNLERDPSRVQIKYLHRREVDKFFELPPNLRATLPPAVIEKLNPRHAVKVRVTYDQKTNAILAKIIKVRVKDLDIYNPAYPLDCRISINFEIKYEGDIEDLVPSTTSADRTKDRLSYSQSHYQIDLTQVTQQVTVNGAIRGEKEHELEVEVNVNTIREQGTLAAQSRPNEYLLLVEGMIDNVRVLQRNVPPPA